MISDKIPSSQNILFLSHGGGPLPLLGDPAHQELVDCLKSIATFMPKPKAIIVISAHWEETQPTITGGTNPGLIYDYYGFPSESYQIQYPAAGAPRLSDDIARALDKAGLKAIIDNHRGFDHGVFVPLKIMFPDADIPCVQISLVAGLDPNTHIQIGEALATLDEEGLLIIGSGFSFHNMRAFFSPNTSTSIAQNEAFEAWLLDTCSSTHLREIERRQRLTNWVDAPGARFCQPREEHLLPLHVCYGVANRACDQALTLEILGKKASMYWWR